MLFNSVFFQGGQPAAMANVASTPQPHPAQLESTSNSMQKPNHGFHQSKLNLEILEWLRAELDGPTEPLPRAGSLSDAWARERLYRKVKSNADKRFKYKQSYKINIGKIKACLLLPLFDTVQFCRTIYQHHF